MSGKGSFKMKLVAAKDRAAHLARRIYHGEEIASGIWNSIINAAKVFIVSARKFIRDDCFTKASSITYTIILSLVPTLAVALSIYSIFGVEKDKKVLFDSIVQFMTEHNIKLNIYPIFDAILGLIENAGKIGGISAAVMIVSATAMLRAMEKSMNSIWRVRRGRPIHMKIVYYWAALTLGPIMLVAGTTAATQISSALSSPNYLGAAVVGERLMMVGDRATIMERKTPGGTFERVPIDGGRIDYDNQRIYVFHHDGGTFTEQEEGRLEPLNLKKARFRGIRFAGDKGWIVGTDGIMLLSTDAGKTWDIRKYGSIAMNDIQMTGPDRGFIAANGGLLLQTRDGWATCQATAWEGRPDLTSISFRGERGIVTGGRGTILLTADGGKTWTMQAPAAAKRRDRPATLYAASFTDDGGIWVAGEEGVLLFSADDGRTWMPKKAKETGLRAAHFFTANEGVAGGDGGTVIRTEDGGDHWETRTVPTIRVNRLMLAEGRLWAIGDAGTVMASDDRGAKWEIVARGRRFGYTVINFLAPFAFIWLLFLLAYITLPNTRVPFRPAALGASFTGAVWVGFILAFIVYVKAFAQGTFAIYGALAAIPLFLLMIYASSLIILLGAEVAYTLMHPATYRSLKSAFREREEIHVYHGIALLRHVYRKFERGLGATQPKELQKAAAVSPEEIDAYVRIFTEADLLRQGGDGTLLPAASSELVTVNNIIDAAMQISLDLPVRAGKSRFNRTMERLLKEIDASRRTTVGNMKLKDLIAME